MPQPIQVDPYLLDVLMRDLVGHDRATAAFIVYLWLWRTSRGEGRPRIGASLQTIATRTGLSKSAVQSAVRHLVRRQLVTASRDRPTVAPVYEVHAPWRRDGVRSARPGSQSRPGRRMVAGLLAGAKSGVDAGRREALRRDGIEQQMVDADAGVAGEGVAPIIPEGVDGLVGVEMADGVGPALAEQAPYWARGSGWNKASSSQRSGL